MDIEVEAAKRRNWYRMGRKVGRGLLHFKEPKMFDFYMNKKEFRDGYFKGRKEEKNDPFD